MKEKGIEEKKKQHKHKNHKNKRNKKTKINKKKIHCRLQNTIFFFFVLSFSFFISFQIQYFNIHLKKILKTTQRHRILFYSFSYRKIFQIGFNSRKNFFLHTDNNLR